ncbi:hypothetical protein [Limosilactobacillus reuteri]|uniref:hypothetical protein n=1 Tax=Limosilactobacillus reuteri TaxID=1598 RepID=UPI002FF17F87
MVVLTELNNASVISGVIAAVISGTVSIVGSIITIYFQNKRNKESLKVQKETSHESLMMQKENNEASIKVQREIANLEKNEKIFYESQLKWANDLREHLAKIIGLIPQYNDLYLKIYMMNREFQFATKERKNELLQLEEENTDSMMNIGKELQEQIGIVRMLLFNKDSSYELEIENRLNEIMTWIIQHDTISLLSVEYLTQAAKKYFGNLMEELEKNKI